MKYSEASAGRVFVVRLEDGDILHECIEHFAEQNGIRAAGMIMLGGADEGSRFVVGPEQGRAEQIVPMTRDLGSVHEAAGVGTIFPDAEGRPVLHMHMSCGRQGDTITGCVRSGVRVWHVMEAVVWEVTETRARRLHDEQSGFALLEP